MKQATPELKAAIHKRLATLRGAAAASAEQGEGVVAFARQAVKDLVPDPMGDPELVGLAALQSINPVDSDIEEQSGQDTWSEVRQAMTREGSQLAGDVAGLAIGEFRDNLKTVRSVVTPHINAVMTEAVSEGAVFMARRNAERERSDTIRGFTAAMTPWLTTSVVELLSQRLTSDTWCEETVTDVREAAETALAPGAKDKGTASKLAQVAERVMKEGVADVLSQGADQLEQVMGKLPHESLKQLASDFVLHSTKEGAVWLEGLVKALYTPGASNHSVVSKVMEKVTREVVAAQRELVQGGIDWIREQGSGFQDQEPHRQQLINLLNPRAWSLVNPTVADVARQLAEQTGQEPKQLAGGVVPYLRQQLAKDQTLEAMVGFSVDWLANWADKNGRVIEDDVESHARELIAEIAKDLEPAICRQLKTLRDSVVKSQKAGENAVTFARRAAHEFAPARVVGTAVGSGNQWAARLPSLIPGLSQGITAVIKQGADVVHSKTGIFPAGVLPIIVPHVQRIVDEAVSAGVEYGIQQLAEPSDGNVDHIARAVSGHLQGIIAGYLSQGVADGIEYAARSVDAGLSTIQTSVEEALTQQLVGEGDENPADLASLLTPQIEGVIDQALNQARGSVFAGMAKWIESNASTATPCLHRAIDQVLVHIMANGGEWLLRHQEGIASEVMPRIQKVVTETLIKAQADIVRSVAIWMSDEKNIKELVSTFTPHILPAVTDIVVQTVARQAAEKTGQNISDIVHSMTPYITPIVDKALTHATACSVRWFADWARQHKLEITSLAEPFIEKTVQDVMPAVKTAVKNKAITLAQNKAQAIDFNTLAAELAVAFADRFDPSSLSTGVV
nr:hypothetical protein [Endozoicomonas sp.]